MHLLKSIVWTKTFMIVKAEFQVALYLWRNTALEDKFREKNTLTAAGSTAFGNGDNHVEAVWGIHRIYIPCIIFQVSETLNAKCNYHEVSFGLWHWWKSTEFPWAWLSKVPDPLSSQCYQLELWLLIFKLKQRLNYGLQDANEIFCS